MHDHSLARSPGPTDALVAAAGPAVIGAILGLQGNHPSLGALGALRDALALPLLIAGVTAAMVPALYIATSLAGAAPHARQVAATVARALRSAGLVMLGLAVPAAFLLTTTRSVDLIDLVGLLVVATAMLIGLRVIFRDLFTDRPALMARAIFALWSLVSLATGMRLFIRFVLA